MKKLGLGAAGLVLAAALSFPAVAHHSAAHFDFANQVTVTGVVKEARFANPHARIILEVAEEGGSRDIEFEGHSRNNMYRQGFRPGMMKAGDTITLQIAPARDGSGGGYVTSLITADGEQIGRITAAD
jgi:D-serine deaminase-like pyridoxal phosphate-dependent protein